MNNMNNNMNAATTNEPTSNDGSNAASPLSLRTQDTSPAPYESPDESTPHEASTSPSETETSNDESPHPDSDSESAPPDPSSTAAKAILETLAALARHSPAADPDNPVNPTDTDNPANLAGLAALARQSALIGTTDPVNPETSTDSTARAARLVLAALTDYDDFTNQPVLIENIDSDDPVSPASRAVIAELVDPSNLSPLIGSAIDAARAAKANPTACNNSSTPADPDETDTYAALAALKVLVDPAHHVTLCESDDSTESTDPAKPVASSVSNIRATLTKYYTRAVQYTREHLPFLSRTRARADPAAPAAFAVITAFRSHTGPTDPQDTTDPINRAASTVIATLKSLADHSYPADSTYLDLNAFLANFAGITEPDDEAVPPAIEALAALVNGTVPSIPTDAANRAAHAILAALSTVPDPPASEDRVLPTSIVTQFVYNNALPEDRNLNFHSASVVVERNRWSLKDSLLSLDIVSLIFVGLLTGCLAIQVGTIIGKLTPLTGELWEVFSFVSECIGFGSYILVTGISTLRYIVYSIPVFTELGIGFVFVGIFYVVLFGVSYKSWTAEASHHILNTREAFMWIAIVFVVLHVVCLFVPKLAPDHGDRNQFTVYAHKCMAKSVLHELEPTNPNFNLNWRERGAKLFVFSSKKLNMEQGSGRHTEPVHTMLLLQEQVGRHIHYFGTPAPDICMSRKQLFEETCRAYLYLSSGAQTPQEAIQLRIDAEVQQLEKPSERAVLYNQLSWFGKIFI